MKLLKVTFSYVEKNPSNKIKRDYYYLFYFIMACFAIIYAYGSVKQPLEILFAALKPCASYQNMK